MKLVAVPAVLLIFVGQMIFAKAISLSVDNVGVMHPMHEDLSFNLGFYSDTWRTYDENNDDKIDHALLFDENGYKVFEVMDFDYNGHMDDFYFFVNGVLVRQEIDQNGDQKIDLWVYITEGVYIEGYERDGDYDGRIDVVKLYYE